MCAGCRGSPFIKHESCIAFDFARTASISAVDAEIAAGSVRLREAVSPDVLVRIQRGFCTSDEVAPNVYADAQGERLAAFLRHNGHL